MIALDQQCRCITNHCVLKNHVIQIGVTVTVYGQKGFVKIGKQSLFLQKDSVERPVFTLGSCDSEPGVDLNISLFTQSFCPNTAIMFPIYMA